ncbi:hypothetical protein Plec18167_007985 [Paecilomyces lecythidis]|uniref:Ferric reductase NAD binding domain-containing protein n=1 Tax=Paecilomyces lecythidis TaxID=3004212 RepID=A0ABR3WZ66_9EURO
MDVIKVELIPGRRLFRPEPGHHYFLYQPLRWRGWESHPFTLGTWTPVSDSGISEKSTPSQSASSRVSIDFNERPGESRLNNMENIVKRENVDTHMIHSRGTENESRRYYKLVFWIRPFSGWTKSLRNACLKNHGHPVPVKFLLEGPYGQSHSIHNYDNVLYITGGTGISAAACYLTDHVYRSSQAPPTTRTKNITLLWSARQAELIRHVATHELAPALKRNDVRTSFFATSGHDEVTQSDFQITAHKPNLTEYIRKYVEDISLESAPGVKTAILACGPASMADEVRATVHALLSEGIKSLYYFEEAYGW